MSKEGGAISKYALCQCGLNRSPVTVKAVERNLAMDLRRIIDARHPRKPEA